MAEMPTDIAYGKVVGRFLLAVGDSGDGDTTPDAVAPPNMKVKFAPKQSVFKTAAPLATVIATTIECTVDTDGHMKDTANNIGVWLIAGVYTVTYAGASLASHEIVVTAENTADAPVHLTTALPAAQPITPTQYSEIDSRLTLLEATPPGGGDGGGGGTEIVWGLGRMTSPVVDQSAGPNSTRRASFDSWSFSMLSGAAFEVSSPDGEYGWGYTEEGWYQITFDLWLQFLAATAPLPSHCVLEFGTWEGLDFTTEIALSTSGIDRVGHGAKSSFTTPVYFSPADSVTGSDQSAHQLTMRWPGDAVLASGNGGDPTFAVKMTVAKLG